MADSRTLSTEKTWLTAEPQQPSLRPWLTAETPAPRAAALADSRTSPKPRLSGSATVQLCLGGCLTRGLRRVGHATVCCALGEVLGSLGPQRQSAERQALSAAPSPGRGLD